MIELINPHRAYFQYDDYREMEKRINDAAINQVAISRLQHLNKYGWSAVVVVVIEVVVAVVVIVAVVITVAFQYNGYHEMENNLTPL